MNRNNARKGQKQTRDPLLGTFATQRQSPHGAVCSLKRDRSYSQAKRIIEHIRPFNLGRALYHKPSVSSWDEVLRPPRFPDSSDWVQEFGWLAHGFRVAASSLCEFLLHRKEFSVAYLLGDYSRADSVLRTVQDQHGLSLWLAERQFMLLQAKEGFEAHKQKLSSIQEKITNSVTGYVVTMLSNRLEPHVTHEAFRLSMQRMLHNLREDGHEMLASVIEIQVYPWSFDWIADGRAMMSCCTGKPLVDRYDKALKIAACLSQDVTEEQKLSLKEVLVDLLSVIPDYQLVNLLLSVDQSRSPVFDENTQEYFTAYDLFIAGEYMECAAKSEALIKKNPTCFDFYWLMAQAIACSSNLYKITLKEASTAYQIIVNLVQIAENRVDMNLPLAALETIALKLGDGPLGMNLWQFALKEGDGSINKQACYQAAIQNETTSISSFLTIDQNESFEALDRLKKTYPGHSYIDLQIYRSCDDRNMDIPAHTTQKLAGLARAARKSLSDNHEGVLRELESIYKAEEVNESETRFYMGEVAILEFGALTGLGEVEKAAAAILKLYTKNPNSLRHVPFEQLIEGAASGQWDVLKDKVYWPILVYLNNGDAQDIYEAVDDLLIGHACTSPLQISDGTIPASVQELRILLRDVLVPSVIVRGALWCRTAEDRRTLRIHLLQKLFSISIEDQALVIKEISDLEQARLLEAAYRNVEGPKFFLDYGEVNKNVAPQLQGSFERYSEYREYEEKGGKLATESDLLELAKTGTTLKPNIERKTETSDLLLSNMAIGAFMEYLWNTHKGVNAVLATRIRHGALENQLKRVFGAHSILAMKGIDGAYKCTGKLAERLRLYDQELREDIEAHYIKFTTEISSIYESLITTHLKVKVPDHIIKLIEEQGLPSRELSGSSGLLDFTSLFSETTVARLKSISFQSVGDLLVETQKIFVETARKAFGDVRTFFEASVGVAIESVIKELDLALEQQMDDGPLRVSLRAEVLAAKDEFAQDLRVIQNWFVDAEHLDTGVGTLGELLLTAARVVNFASNGKLGDVVKINFEDERLSSSVSVAMYESLLILLRNVVRHSGVESLQKVECEHEIFGNGRRLTLRNDVFDAAHCVESVRHAVELSVNPIDERILDRSPGQTGINRVQSLLRHVGFANAKIVVSQGNNPHQFQLEVSY